MITESYDEIKTAFINPPVIENRIQCDVIIVTFSNEIEEYVVNKFNAKKISDFTCVNGHFPIYTFKYNNKVFGFYRTLLGAPASVGILEETAPIFDCKKFLVFGSAGTLDKDCKGKVVVPTAAYRDEGTSYHYAKASDYIELVNHPVVAKFMEKHKIPYRLGKTWTTDAFYRETKKHIDNRKREGCVVVDMECSAMQAVCNFRNLDLYYFLMSGDLLDASEWDKEGLKEANHNFHNFDVALQLACEL